MVWNSYIQLPWASCLFREPDDYLKWLLLACTKILPSFCHLMMPPVNPTACSNCRGHVVGPWRSIGSKSVQVGPLHFRGILRYITYRVACGNSQLRYWFSGFKEGFKEDLEPWKATCSPYENKSATPNREFKPIYALRLGESLSSALNSYDPLSWDEWNIHLFGLICDFTTLNFHY